MTDRTDGPTEIRTSNVAAKAGAHGQQQSQPTTIPAVYTTTKADEARRGQTDILIMSSNVNGMGKYIASIDRQPEVCILVETHQKKRKTETIR